MASTVMSLKKSCFDGNKLCGGSITHFKEEEEESGLGFGLFFFVEDIVVGWSKFWSFTVVSIREQNCPLEKREGKSSTQKEQGNLATLL